MQAIITKYIGPSATKPSRIKATCYGGSVTISYDHAATTDGAHRKAAMALAAKLGWQTDDWVEGGLPNGNVYVQTPKA